MNDVMAKQDLLTIPDGEFTETNRIILDEAQALGTARGEAVCALLVWDGKARGEDDMTEDFRNHARMRGLRVLEILTLRTCFVVPITVEDDGKAIPVPEIPGAGGRVITRLFETEPRAPCTSIPPSTGLPLNGFELMTDFDMIFTVRVGMVLPFGPPNRSREHCCFSR